MSHPELGILALITATSLACQSLAPVVQGPTPTPTRLDPTDQWLSYEYPRLGISFRYPPGLALLLDDPDGSGAQFEGDGMILNLVVNPRSETTAENVVSRLASTGFEESRRSDVKKGPWEGLRVEGFIDSFGFEYEEVIFIVQSGTSQLSLSVIGEPPIDHGTVDGIWGSLVISRDEFSLSSALLDPASVSTLSPADGTFSFRYPTKWQAAPFGESGVWIVDPDDQDGLLVTAGRIVDSAVGLNAAVEDRLRSYRAAFKDVHLGREDAADVSGSTAASRIGGTLVFQDGASGGFETVVAASRARTYYVEVIGLRAKLSAEQDFIEQILQSFALSPQ